MSKLSRIFTFNFMHAHCFFYFVDYRVSWTPRASKKLQHDAIHREMLGRLAVLLVIHAGSSATKISEWLSV